MKKLLPKAGRVYYSFALSAFEYFISLSLIILFALSA
jgi:hypothetical protein